MNRDGGLVVTIVIINTALKCAVYAWSSKVRHLHYKVLEYRRRVDFTVFLFVISKQTVVQSFVLYCVLFIVDFNMACEVSQDDDVIGEALLIGEVRHQVLTALTEGNTAVVSLSETLPEARPISNRQDQILVEQLAETIRVIGDKLDQDTEFNDMIDGLGKVCDKSSFWKLVETVFKDDQINWGRIVVLFYSVGKLAVKMAIARLPEIVSVILNLSLDFFKKTLLNWIRTMGGWISSIPALARFSIERFSSSSLRTYSSIFGAMLCFTSGVLVGAFILWRLQKSS